MNYITILLAAFAGINLTITFITKCDSTTFIFTLNAIVFFVGSKTVQNLINNDNSKYYFDRIKSPPQKVTKI